MGSLEASEDAIDLKVNRFSRNDVVAFWHRYYMASEGYQNRWEGTVDVDSCTVTAPPEEFTRDVQRRVNYYRAMVGLRANINFEEKEVRRTSDDAFAPAVGTSKAAAARAAALVLAVQDFDVAIPESLQITHSLDDTWDCFTPTAWNGATNSNLGAIAWGPGAIDGYMGEPGNVGDPLANRFVGHRRWIFYSGAANMATGDVPPILKDGRLIRPGINALYVVGDFAEDREIKFAAWPNDGFSPAPLLTDLWSLSYPGADFSDATITMTGPQGVVDYKVVSRSLGVPYNHPGSTGPREGENSDTRDQPNPGATGPRTGVYADATIVWQPKGIASDFSEDVTYQVTIDNILGGGPTQHSYSVTLMNPDVLTNLDLVGSDAPPVTGANYYFGPVSQVDEFQFEVTQRANLERVEGAELTPRVIDNTSPDYDLVGSHRFSLFEESQFYLGSKSFRLAFKDNSSLDQNFVLDENLSTSQGAVMTFKYRQGFMTSETHLDVEFSTDGGVSWFPSGSRITGIDRTIGPGFQDFEVALPVAESLRVRFRKRYIEAFLPPVGFNYLNQDPNSEYPIGVFIDDIRFTNTESATSPAILTIPGGDQQASFSPDTLGLELAAGATYSIRIRPTIAGFSFAWSPVKQVIAQPSSALVDFERWADLTYPTAGDFHSDFDRDGLPDGLEYALGTSPISSAEGIASFGLTQEGNRLCLSVPADSLAPGISYGAEWSTDLRNWSSEDVTIKLENGFLKAFAPAAMQGMVSMRWVISQE